LQVTGLEQDGANASDRVVWSRPLEQPLGTKDGYANGLREQSGVAPGLFYLSREREELF
jgi:hypothetical protein